MKSLFEQNGGTYSIVGDYQIPNLTLPEQKGFTFGRYGKLRLNYLKNHRKALFTSLLTSCGLSQHLAETDKQAKQMLDTLMKQMAKQQGVTEQLKANDQMAWVGAMNNIKACAEEIVLNEIIYT